MLKAGTLSEFDDSMAEAIETVFERIWNSSHARPLPGDLRARDERRALYIAIARGVLDHLQKHACDGFVVTVGENKGTLEIRREQGDEEV